MARDEKTEQRDYTKLRFDGAHVQYVARERGIRLEQMAVAADRTAMSMWRYLHGQTKPKQFVAKRIADCIGVPVEELWVPDEDAE